MQQLLRGKPPGTVGLHRTVLGGNAPPEGVENAVLQALFQNLRKLMHALRKLFGQPDADDAAVHAQPVVQGGGFSLVPLPASGENTADDEFIELAPDPDGRSQRDQVAPVVHQVGAVVAEVQIHFRLGGRVPVGYHPDAVRQQVGLRRSLDTGPPQLDLRPWVGHLRPQRKGIDGCGNAEDRVGRDIADAVVLGHGARNGAGDELRLVDTPVIGADAGIRLIDGAVKETHLGILHRGLQRGAA